VVPEKGTQPPDERGEKKGDLTVEIVCPNCGFLKSIPDEKIPAGVRFANCPRCKNRFELAIQTPSFGLEKAQEVEGKTEKAERIAPPWERRPELGVWKGIHQTTRAVLFSPKDLFRTMAIKEGFGEPLAFGLLVGAIGTMVGFFWQFLLMSESLMSISQGYLDQFSMPFVFIGLMVLSPIYVILTILVTAAIIHLCLLVVRGGKNGFAATFRVICYSQATQILAFVPILGGMVGLVWQCFVQMIGLREIHETSYARIVIAFLIPLVLIVLLALAIVIPLFMLT
jgi:hypothetical protein